MMLVKAATLLATVLKQAKPEQGSQYFDLKPITGCRGLSRPRCKRPRHRSATENTKEIPPSHVSLGSGDGILSAHASA